MKVALYPTVEVSDDQRVAIAAVLDGEDAKKRQASRDEIKEYVWAFGAGWPRALAAGVAPGGPGDSFGDVEEPEEDLIGAPEPDDEDDDLDLEDLI